MRKSAANKAGLGLERRTGTNKARPTERQGIPEHDISMIDGTETEGAFWAALPLIVICRLAEHCCRGCAGFWQTDLPPRDPRHIECPKFWSQSRDKRINRRFFHWTPGADPRARGRVGKS